VPHHYLIKLARDRRKVKSTLQTTEAYENTKFLIFQFHPSIKLRRFFFNTRSRVVVRLIFFYVTVTLDQFLVHVRLFSLAFASSSSAAVSNCVANTFEERISECENQFEYISMFYSAKSSFRPFDGDFKVAHSVLRASVWTTWLDWPENRRQ
jgi:hypothetical protein